MSPARRRTAVPPNPVRNLVAPEGTLALCSVEAGDDQHPDRGTARAAESRQLESGPWPRSPTVHVDAARHVDDAQTAHRRGTAVSAGTIASNNGAPARRRPAETCAGDTFVMIMKQPRRTTPMTAIINDATPADGCTRFPHLKRRA
jgi:hypothetical protein